MHHGNEEGYFGKHILQENVLHENVCCGIPTCKEADARGPGSRCTPACPRIFPKLWQKSWWWRLWSRQASKRALVASQRDAGSKDAPGLGNTNGKNCRERQKYGRKRSSGWKPPRRKSLSFGKKGLQPDKKTKNWLGSFSSSWSAGIRKPTGKGLLLKDKRRPNGLCLGETWPEKNLRQPSVMFSKGGGRLQPHDAVVATKKHQTAYLCARPPNLLEQRRSKNCLEPHCRTIHPKGERATGAAKTTGKLEAGRTFGENKGGGGTNKIGLLCDSADQNCKKNWISLHANIPSRTAQRQSFNVPRTILFLSPMGEDG